MLDQCFVDSHICVLSKFVICRRDNSKNAPSVFFEEKEDENFASKMKYSYIDIHGTTLAFNILIIM